MLDLANGITMPIVADPKTTTPLGALRRDAQQPLAEVTGVSRAVSKSAEELAISSASSVER